MGAKVSGYAHSGMNEEDYKARETIRSALEEIRERYPEEVKLVDDLNKIIVKIEDDCSFA